MKRCTPPREIVAPAQAGALDFLQHLRILNTRFEILEPIDGDRWHAIGDDLVNKVIESSYR